MKKQLLIIGIVALLVSVGLSGCDQVSNTLNPEKNKFVGTWKGRTTLDIVAVFDPTNVTLTFFSDNTYSINSLSNTWEIKDGKLVLGGTSLLTNSPLQTVYSYTFANNDRTLTITDVAGNNTPLSYLVLTKQ
jgi:hypothetical protein